jgi:hypothetical protein
MSEQEKPAFTPEQAFDFLSRMWNPMSFAAVLPGLAGAAGAAPQGSPFMGPGMFATLDPKEVEVRIRDLKTIEGWLSMNVNMIQLTIKTLELQKASLEALQATAQAAGATPQK